MLTQDRTKSLKVPPNFPHIESFFSTKTYLLSCDFNVLLHASYIAAFMHISIHSGKALKKQGGDSWTCLTCEAGIPNCFLAGAHSHILWLTYPKRLERRKSDCKESRLHVLGGRWAEISCLKYFLKPKFSISDSLLRANVLPDCLFLKKLTLILFSSYLCGIVKKLQ